MHQDHYQAPLNAQLVGGDLTWEGNLSDWKPYDVCVDWESNNFAWVCSFIPTGRNKWSFTNCTDISSYGNGTRISCVDFYACS